MTSALDGGGCQRHAPAAFTPGKNPVPIVQEAGWAPGLVWMGAENLAPQGFDPQTIQPVASCYTNYAILAPQLHGLIASPPPPGNHPQHQGNDRLSGPQRHWRTAKSLAPARN